MRFQRDIHPASGASGTLSPRRARARRWICGVACVIAAASAFDAARVLGETASAGTAVWGPATELALPTGATTVAGGQSASLSGLSCTDPGDCIGVGYYADSSGTNDYLAMTLKEAGGAWASSSSVALPSNHTATAGGQRAYLNSLSCTSPGNCEAVGGYNDSNGAQDGQAMAVEDVDGTWSQASEVMPPSDALTAPGTQAAYLGSVSCTGPGDCVAVGGYEDYNPPLNTQEAMVATETNGLWARAQQLQLPSDADTADRERGYLNSVDCTSLGNCVAVGAYTDTNGIPQELVATETAGTWAQAVKIAVPASNGQPYPQGENAALESVTCRSAGNCVTVGYYHTAANDTDAMVAEEVNGAWSPSQELALPSDAVGAGDQAAYANAVTCTSEGNCVIGGSYADATSNNALQAMVIQEIDGVWGAGTRVLLPAGYNPTPNAQSAGLDAITCLSQGRCVAGGSYTDTNASVQAMAIRSLPLLAITTASLPSATVGSAYSTQLTASGGSGVYRWSVSAGSLPPGLSLDAATGVISGSPTDAGSASLTITANDQGPPAQQASAALSIVVAAGPAAEKTATTGSPQVTNVTIGTAELTVTVSCAGSSTENCSGTAAVSTVEHLSGKEITAITARKQQKPSKRTVVLARASYRIAGGGHEKLILTLNSLATKLLTSHHVLPAKLTVTPASAGAPVLTRAIAFKAAQKKKKRAHN